MIWRRDQWVIVVDVRKRPREGQLGKVGKRAVINFEVARYKMKFFV